MLSEDNRSGNDSTECTDRPGPDTIAGACPEPVLSPSASLGMNSAEGPAEGACPEPVEGACPELVEGACPELVEG